MYFRFFGCRVNPIDVNQLCKSFYLKVSRVGGLLVLSPPHGGMRIFDLEKSELMAPSFPIYNWTMEKLLNLGTASCSKLKSRGCFHFRYSAAMYKFTLDFLIEHSGIGLDFDSL